MVLEILFIVGELLVFGRLFHFSKIQQILCNIFSPIHVWSVFIKTISIALIIINIINIKLITRTGLKYGLALGISTFFLSYVAEFIVLFVMGKHASLRFYITNFFICYVYFFER